MHRFLHSTLCIVILGLLSNASAQTLTNVHAFQGTTDGGTPQSWLIADAAGNLYGTSFGGGAHRFGNVFELQPPQNGGSWTENVLYSFQGGNDGSSPEAGVVFDKAGNLYGTTAYGGGSNNCGTIFELQPGSGGWSEQILHTFNCADGDIPNGLILGPGGALFGSTLWGNNIFRLAPGNDGQWHFANLYTLHPATDGEEVLYTGGNLIVDGAGNLYGVAAFGGADDSGTVFELLKPGAPGGAWTINVLYTFTGGNDGGVPLDSLLLYQGNLYGTTASGGPQGDGVVFELTPGSAGWTETVLHSFSGDDGAGPRSALIHDGSGNLYGTTFFGGTGSCNEFGKAGCGTAFKLQRPSEPGGVWLEGALSFNVDFGMGPYARLFGSDKRLFGTVSAGGQGDCDENGCGAVFEITP